MTIGLGTRGVAPGCGDGAGSDSGSGSPTMSARRFESGDHSCPCRRPLISVSCIASPPLRSSSHTWLPRALPGRDEVNERYLPSGLQRGEFSLSELKVICRSLLPSMFTIQMCEFDLSSLVSVVPTTYATHWPSGEICGSLTLRKRVRSSSFIGRRAVCAARELASARMSSREIEDRRRRSIGASRNVVLRAYSAETEVSHAKTQRRKESRKGNSILFAFSLRLCVFA